MSSVLRQFLSKAGHTSLEVALELWLALTASPQARWLQFSSSSAASAMLQVCGWGCCGQEARQKGGLGAKQGQGSRGLGVNGDSRLLMAYHHPSGSTRVACTISLCKH